jgi:hypothetical protein
VARYRFIHGRALSLAWAFGFGFWLMGSAGPIFSRHTLAASAPGPGYSPRCSGRQPMSGDGKSSPGAS